MSKYHKLQTKCAKQDWTSDEGIVKGLQGGLKLEGYGTEFRIWQNGLPIDEETARQAIIAKVTSSPLMEKYQQSLQEMEVEGFLDTYDIFAKADPELIFEHGDFQRSVNLADEFEVVTGAKELEKRHKRRTKKQRDKEEDAQKLKNKLDETQNTDENHYLLHANQCGYLLKNTAIRFNSSALKQWGTSIMTRVRGITLPELRDFIDSAGKATLSMISTHMDHQPTEYTDDDGGGDSRAGIEAMHRAFAEEIVDFLNLELEVDIGGLVKQYSNKTDSAFQSIEHWIEQDGGDKGMVLRKLIERNGNVDSNKITKQFELGYESKLMA